MDYIYVNLRFIYCLVLKKRFLLLRGMKDFNIFFRIIGNIVFLNFSLDFFLVYL